MGILMRMAKSRAIKKIAKRMPGFLVGGYGYSESYTTGQVETALESTGCNPDYIDHAYAMYCNEESFNGVSSGDYDTLHQDVTDTCFGGNDDFSFSDASSFGGFDGGGGLGGGGDGGGGD